MKQNLAFAFLYNALGVPMAAGRAVSVHGWLLSPMIAALAMSLSSASVIGNALRLRADRRSRHAGAVGGAAHALAPAAGLVVAHRDRCLHALGRLLRGAGALPVHGARLRRHCVDHALVHGAQLHRPGGRGCLAPDEQQRPDGG
jgi:hypothetical protein